MEGPSQLEVDIVKWFMGVVGVLMGVLYKLNHGRLLRLQAELDSKVDRVTMDSMQALAKEHRDETRANFSTINQTLNTILLKLGDRS